MEIIGTLFCGLGLFFIGFRLISQNLRLMVSGRFKRMIERATQTRMLSALTGFLSGMITQSGSAAVFITTGFISAGLLSLKKSMSLMNWANIGTSAMVFIVILNIKVITLNFVGLIGIAFFLQLDKTNKMRVVFQFLLGISLLFLGVMFIRNSAGPMQSLPWFRDMLKISAQSLALLFLSGILLTVAAQSGTTVSVVALSLLSVGLLSMMQTLVIVMGTGIGSAVNIILLSSRLKGSGKQVSFYQAIFKTTGVIALALLIFPDYLLSGDHSVHLFSILPSDPGKMVASLFLIMQLLPALLLTVLKSPVAKSLLKIAPPSHHESLSQPEYLNVLALVDPETSLLLVGQEQYRIMKWLPDYLLPVCPDRGTKVVLEPQVLKETTTLLSQNIRHFLEELAKKPAAAEMQEQIVQAQQMLSLMSDLDQNLEEFMATIQSSFNSVVDLPFTVNLVESLRTLLETVNESFLSPDVAGLDMIISLTSDKGDTLQRIRQNFFVNNAGLELPVRQSLFTLTLLFDRICWLLKSMSLIKLKSLSGN